MKEKDSKKTKRAVAFELWMNVSNLMVTVFKTLDVTRLIKISKQKNLIA